MTTKIKFEEIQNFDNTRLEMTCVVTTPDLIDSFNLWFEFSTPVRLTNDTIAIALSTLCGRSYSEIAYDLTLSEQAVKSICTFTQANVLCGKGQQQYEQVNRSGITLSFSGGFDSLAALALMPNDTRLVSMDFGGRFGRERAFFQTFETTIISTNLLTTSLSKNSWSFMGIGSILTSQHLPSEYHTFGSILEAGADNLRVNPAAASNKTFPPFEAAGFRSAPYVAGLTEIGTLMVLSRNMPERISPSLLSLASPGEEKLYRKKVLAEIVASRLGLSLSFPEVVKPPEPHLEFGRSFTLDFLSLYVCKFAGRDMVDTMVRNFPVHFEKLAAGMALSLFERANTTLYSKFPRRLFGALAGKLSDAGVDFYTESDWIEYQGIREAFAPYYPMVQR